MKKYIITYLLIGALASIISPVAKAAANTWTGDSLFEGNVDVGNSTWNSNLAVPYGSLFLGESASSTNSRLVLKAKGASSVGSFIETINSLGVPTITVFDSGKIRDHYGYIELANRYNSHTISINSAERTINSSDYMHMNGTSSASLFVNQGGGVTGFGIAGVYDARFWVANTANAPDWHTLVRVIAKQGQTGNFFEAQTSTGTKLIVVNAAGKMGIGTSSPTAVLDVRGEVKFERQGDILMGEFGNP